MHTYVIVIIYILLRLGALQYSSMQYTAVCDIHVYTHLVGAYVCYEHTLCMYTVCVIHVLYLECMNRPLDL